MSEPEEYFIDGPNFIESSELEEVMDEVHERLKILESKLAVTAEQPIKDAEGEILHAGLATLTGNVIIQKLGLTYIELADLLNGVSVFDSYNNYVGTKRIVTAEEESFREFASSGLSGKFFTIYSLKTVKVYQADFDRFCKEWGMGEQSTVVDTSDLEEQLAEARQEVAALKAQLEKIQSGTLIDLSKDLNQDSAESIVYFVQEGNVETALEFIREKDARIAELEAEPATTVNAAKWEGSVKAAFAVWVSIIGEEKNDWTRGKFTAAVRGGFYDYHSTVLEAAWSALPGRYKNGKGRPKKKQQ